jgi:hypothetical protein
MSAADQQGSSAFLVTAPTPLGGKRFALAILAAGYALKGETERSSSRARRGPGIEQYLLEPRQCREIELVRRRRPHRPPFSSSGSSIDEAIPYFEQAIHLSPHEPGIAPWYGREGVIYLLQSHTDDAIASLEKASSEPVAIPARACSLADLISRRSIASMMPSPARTARSASSSCACG